MSDSTQEALDILMELAAHNEPFPGEHEPCCCYPDFSHGYDSECWYHRAWVLLTRNMDDDEINRFQDALHNWRDHAGPKPRMVLDGARMVIAGE